MKRLFSFVGAMGTMLLASAQLTSISIETVLEHDGTIILPASPNADSTVYSCGPTGMLFVQDDQNLCEYSTPELIGYTTYRIYANLISEYDFVSAVYGDSQDPMFLNANDIFQVGAGGDFANNVNISPLILQAFPELAYDSWFTIGAADASEGGALQTTFSSSSELVQNFQVGQGFSVTDPIGGSWFNTYPCVGQDLATCSEGVLGFAGADLKVLIGQITATGDVTGMFNVQVFPDGNQDDTNYATGATFSTNPADTFGCTDEDATNFDATVGATIDDLSCTYPCELELDSAAFTISPPTCSGENDGFILAAAVGAQGADYFYLDSISDVFSNFGNFTPSNNYNLQAGTYDIIVVDAAQCGDTLSVTVPEVDPVTMSAELTTAVSCHNAADGVITITAVSGGDGNYSFGISSDPTSLSSDLVWEGIGTTNGNNQTYSFTVFDGNGCAGESEGIFVSNPQEMFIGFSTTIPNPVVDASCANVADGSIYVIGNGGATQGVGPYNFSVDGETFGPSPLTVSGGTYNVTVMDPDGCTATLEDVYVGPAPIEVNAAVEPELCSGEENGEVSWAPTNGDGNYTFTFEGEATPETMAEDLAPGTYTVVVTDGQGCTGEETVEVEAALAISVITDVVDASCFEDNDGAITVNGVGGSGSFEYSEDGNNFIPNNEFGGFEAGTYTVFVQDEFGCVESASATVGQPDAIVITGIVSEGSATGEGTINVTVTGGNLPYEYEWIGQGVSGQDTQDLEGISSGSYTVEVTDANGCSSIETFNITTDLREIEAGVLATVYPNPSQGVFTVDILGGFQGQVQYHVVDAQGRQILNGQWNASEGFFRTDLDLSAAEAGMYRLVMMANGRPSSLQLVKTH